LTTDQALGLLLLAKGCGHRLLLIAVLLDEPGDRVVLFLLLLVGSCPLFLFLGLLGCRRKPTLVITRSRRSGLL
jgi:hypothetical protein